MITDAYQTLLTKAQSPMLKATATVPMASASQKLTDGRRVTVTCKRDTARDPAIPGPLRTEWFIDGMAVDNVVAKVALANFA